MSIYQHDPNSHPPVVREQDIETDFVEKLRSLKYEYRPDIRDRDTLQKNFREKFEALNRVQLTESEFQRLLEEIITPDVFAAARFFASTKASLAMTARLSITRWSISRTGAKTPLR